MSRLHRPLPVILLAVGLVSLLTSAVQAQLRIVSYNTTGAPRAGMDFILQAIGEESVVGVQRPIDILLLQEQSNDGGLANTTAFVNLLNNTIYPGQGFAYAKGQLVGNGDTTQTIVYRTDTVALMGQSTVGTVSTSGQARQTLRYKVKPFDYDDSAAFYIYNSHYRSSEGATNADRRLVEANAIRANSDASLGEGAHAIYAGDHNFYDVDETEPAVAALTTAGPGQANDPINLITDWNSSGNPSLLIRKSHTQSPTTTARYGGQAVSGLDDRFDFQWVTGEMLDNEGMSYISGTYRAFGNNGTTWNTDIDAGTNTYPFDGVSFGPSPHTRVDLLTNLASVTDHIPVVADYQIPAKMGVEVASIPLTATLNSIVPITVSIENIAPSPNFLGADELDYVLSVSGDLTGGIAGTDPAGGGGHDETIFLNTSSPGFRTGMITVTTSSQGASNALFTLPVSFTVGSSFLAADFDEDGSVDGEDLAAWTIAVGLNTGALKEDGDADLDGDVDGADLVTWQQQQGSPPPGFVAVQAAAPEPASLVLAVSSLAFLARRRF